MTKRPFMTIHDLVNDLLNVYTLAKVQFPEMRAISLRLLEETVELCLACGASPADIYTTIHDTLKNEHRKHPKVGFNDSVVADQSEITGELADVALLQAFTQRLAAVYDDELLTAAQAKIERLLKAQQDGKLRWTADGRFYRNNSGPSTVENAPPAGRANGGHPMGHIKGKYQGEDVEVIRVATKDDQGFDAAKGEQVIIQKSDGSKETATKSEVQTDEPA